MPTRGQQALGIEGLYLHSLARAETGADDDLEVLAYVTGDDIPVFLLDICFAGEPLRLTNPERVELAECSRRSRPSIARARGLRSSNLGTRAMVKATRRGQRLLQAAKEALAIAKGEAERGATVVRAPSDIDVKAIRRSLGSPNRSFEQVRLLRCADS